MDEFVRAIIVPIIRERRWSSVCEIGASKGLSTDCLLSVSDLAVTVIDPCLDLDLTAKYSTNPRVQVRKGNSLDVLPALDVAFDCILIDGDHNWYTVYNELRVIFERCLLRRGGMIFFDDIEWPYGRRDMYYQPDTIPAQYRQAYSRGGVIRGKSKLSSDSGLNSGFYNAVREGGPRNGVLTAVEDFLHERRHDCQFAAIRKNEGLGALYYRKGFGDGLTFLKFQCRTSAYNLLTLPKRFAKTRLPSVYFSAKSTFGRT